MATAPRSSEFNCRMRSTSFVLFDEEEVGLIGSKRYAQKLANEDLDVHSVCTIDQMGWDSKGDRLIAVELPDGNLLALYEEEVKDTGVSIPINETNIGSNDHSLLRPYVEAIGLTEGYKSGDITPHYHKSTDTYDTINFEYLRSNTVPAHHVWAGLVYDPQRFNALDPFCFRH